MAVAGAVEKGGAVNRREAELTTDDLVAGASDRRDEGAVDVDRGERYSTSAESGATSAQVVDVERDVESRPSEPEQGVASQPASTQPDFEPLLSEDDTESFRSRWQSIQAGFVDEPRRATEEADRLVAELMARLAETFSDERARLEALWGRGEEVTTEDLRVALQRYKSFFNRLLSV